MSENDEKNCRWIEVINVCINNSETTNSQPLRILIMTLGDNYVDRKTMEVCEV